MGILFLETHDSVLILLIQFTLESWAARRAQLRLPVEFTHIDPEDVSFGNEILENSC
jgi:hypothetical protein